MLALLLRHAECTDNANQNKDAHVGTLNPATPLDKMTTEFLEPQLSLCCGLGITLVSVDNYFNYFTEIEEHFQRRRGSILLLSTLDWALMETWKDAGIPLEAVLRGIDTTFDKWDQRPSKTRKVNGLGFCTQEVLAAAEEMKDASL